MKCTRKPGGSESPEQVCHKMPMNRCCLSYRSFFFFIVCVASLSVILNYQVSYYGTDMVERRLTLNEVYRLHDVPEVTDAERYDVKLLGRSLNQHAVESPNTRATDKLSVKLLTKLMEIENRLLEAKQRVIAIVDDGTVEDGDDLKNRLRQLDIDVVKNNDGLSWIDEDTVVQGNWSILLCFDGNHCPHKHIDISQKVNKIPAFTDMTEEPEVTCSVSKLVEHELGGELSVPCESFSCDYPLASNTILAIGSRMYFNTTRQELCKRWSGFPHAVVWYLPESPVTFLDGPILRINCLIVSVYPLRVYVHPEMHSGPYSAVQHPSLLKKISIEDVLQGISETYGLGTSSGWWGEVQRRLLLYLIYFETETHKSKRAGIRWCSRCFQSLQFDLMCPSVQRCRIIQMRTEQVFDSTIIGSTAGLVNSRRHVSTDIELALTNMQHKHIVKICDDQYDAQDECLSETDLVYLLDWRREMNTRSDWIPVYPSKFGCKELKRHDVTTSAFSDTIRFNDMLNTVGEEFRRIDQPSTESHYLLDGEDDYVDVRLTKNGRKHTEGTTRPCSNDSKDFGKLEEIFTYPRINFEELYPNSYNVSVDYHTILIRLWVVSKSCTCQVKLENKYNDPGPRNITLGLGENKIMVYVVHSASQDLNIVSTVTITIYRHNRGLGQQYFHEQELKMCGLKQDCSLPFDNTAACGLVDLQTSWTEHSHTTVQTRCTSGDHEGQWIVPCNSCSHDGNDCFWTRATWQPYTCQYKQFPPSALRQCLHGKKLLFIGDSTNRGVSNYIIEQINGSLFDWDKTHSTRVYSNINEDRSHFTFAYYPHFWLPSDHRPKFSKVIYQLIKSSLPLENNSNTVLVVGGVQWLAKQHIDLIIEALQRKGLSGITKAVKGLGAGFHQPVENVRFVPKSENSYLQQRESEVLDYAKTKGFHPVATFNMTLSRYEDFMEGNCACHFHKVLKHGTSSQGYRYSVEGDINAAYSQILMNQICPDVSDNPFTYPE